MGGEGYGRSPLVWFYLRGMPYQRDPSGGTAYRVDGAPTLADAQAFLVDLVGAMKQTLADSDKFQRFVKNVLATNTPENQDELKGELEKSIKIREGYNLRNFFDFDPNVTAPQAPTRFGRLDAVDSIVNEAFWATVKNQDLNNPTVVAKPGTPSSAIRSSGIRPSTIKWNGWDRHQRKGGRFDRRAYRRIQWPSSKRRGSPWGFW